jgi:hypothetical protein
MYQNWLSKVDGLIGSDDRRDMAVHYSFRAAFDDGLTPRQACEDCVSWLELDLTAFPALRG